MRRKRKNPAWFGRLARIARDFPVGKTHVVGVGFDMKARTLEVELNNGYTLVMHADGTSRVVRKGRDFGRG